MTLSHRLVGWDGNFASDFARASPLRLLHGFGLQKWRLHHRACRCASTLISLSDPPQLNRIFLQRHRVAVDADRQLERRLVLRGEYSRSRFLVDSLAACSQTLPLVPKHL